MKKIAVLYICTGEYVKLWPEFLVSAEKYLLKQSEVHYFVFTDAKCIQGEKENPRIHRIYQQQKPWPYATLMRFEIFLTQEEVLQKYDYLFFFNANAEFTAPVTEEAFLPRAKKGETLLFVQHPAFYYRPNYEFTYDRNPRCKAYIPMGLGKYYVCGGVNGGTAKAFLKLSHTLDKRIKQDLKKGIIAVWHDESHINWYVFTHRHYRILDASYCWPDGWNVPKPCIILIRTKEKYFDVWKFRKQGVPKTTLSPALQKYNDFIMKTCRYIQRRLPWYEEKKR